MLVRIAPVLLFFLSGPLVGCQISGEEKAALLADIDAAATAVAKQEDLRKEGVRKALGSDSLPNRPCPPEIEFVDRSGTPKPEYTRPSDGSNNYSEGEVEELLGRPGFRAEWANGELDSLRHTASAQGFGHSVESLVQGGVVLNADNLAWFAGRIAEVADPTKAHRYEVILGWVDVERGLEIDGQHYPSRVRARGLVWDHVDAAVVCSVEVEDVADDSIEVLYDEDEGMTKDDVRSAAEHHLFDKTRDTALQQMGLTRKSR